MDKGRKEVVDFIEKQLDWDYENIREKGIHGKYGLQELRELLDFIYGEEPVHESEQLSRSRKT